MAYLVKRPQLTWWESLYLPAIFAGLGITFTHLVKRFLGFTKVTMQYPDEKWTVPPGYRGAPLLIKDENGREKCVSCQLCEFICPPRAIRVTCGEIPAESPNEKIEKAPQEFQIDMTRCIYCGFCEEVCPEEAIFLRNDYALTGLNRAELLHNKTRLYELGGILPRPIKKWQNK